MYKSEQFLKSSTGSVDGYESPERSHGLVLEILTFDPG
jgi:hypothetical protein